jgi:hypothetical protein
MTQHPFSLAEITELVHIAERAAIKAGIYLLEKRGQARIQAKKASRDDLLDVDLEMEILYLPLLSHSLLMSIHKQESFIGLIC